MKKYIPLDSDTADRIAADVIKQHIKLLNANVLRLRKVAKPSAAQAEDLANDYRLLVSLKDVYKYFTGSN